LEVVEEKHKGVFFPDKRAKEPPEHRIEAVLRFLRFNPLLFRNAS
jgi:hypothetical protein